MYTKRVQKLSPYVPGEQPQDKKYIKLNTNENPYPPAPGVEKVLKEFNIDDLRRYPDPESLKFKSAVADFYKVETANVFAGNGSDEILALAFYTFFDSDEGTLMFPDPSYSFYPVYCNFFNIEYSKIPVNKDFSIDIEKIKDGSDNCGLIFPNPNAPTSIALTEQQIIEILDNFPSDKAVIIDEAYADFCEFSAVKLIEKYSNLIVVKTLSKSRSLAGSRIGYAISSEENIRMMTAAKDSFNSYPIDRITEAAAVEAFRDKEYFEKTTARICKTRDRLSAELRNMGWELPESGANFIFARKPGIGGETIYKTLKEHGILVRFFNKPGISDYVRITIGTEEETDILLSKLAELF
jgi:histidinol-phosphate aminotransferase